MKCDDVYSVSEFSSFSAWSTVISLGKFLGSSVHSEELVEVSPMSCRSFSEKPSVFLTFSTIV